MTDAQILGAVIGALAAAGAAFRWAIKLIVDAARGIVDRVIKAIDENAAQNRRAIEENTASNRERVKAELAHAEQMAVLSTKIDTVEGWVRDHTPVRGVQQYDLEELAPDTPSERRRMARERAPNGMSTVPEPIPEQPNSAPYHYVKPRR